LSADTRPHFTTLASFVSQLEREIVSLFRDVLLFASELGLIGKEHFAVDGCKLPSNASKQWSGTHQELNDKRKKLEHIAELIVAKHCDQDGVEDTANGAVKDAEKLKHYRRKVTQIKAFLEQASKKVGPTGNEQKSNLTDPESAKMSSSRGVLQGYNGLAVVDDRAQIVVHAAAHGSGYEGHLLAPLIEATRETFNGMAGQARTPFSIEATRETFNTLQPGKDVFASTKVTADSGFHSKVVVAEVEKTGADATIADRDYRRRDPAFASADRHKTRDKKERSLKRRREREARAPSTRRLFVLQDFIYDDVSERCVCPAGHSMYHSGRDMAFNGYRVAPTSNPLLVNNTARPLLLRAATARCARSASATLRPPNSDS
jgi:hypothetical protein